MIRLEQYLSVTALTKYIKAKLEGDKHLFSILLKGEISNFKKHSRGHLYFTLKDEGAQISAIMFASDTTNMSFSPKDGDHVLVSGKISLYEPSGSYSIQIKSMKLDGIGELYLKYEALKKELELKGYFSLEHKREIPKYPKVIGVITSPTGAVIEDIKNTVTRRYLLTEIHLYPALVQGPGSADSIRNQIIYANQKGEADVLIVGRGGGSIEDLWAFNEMPVIEAIYQSKIPVITAIGHETDFTLSDFVSDLRAPTPTAAAELATPNKIDLKIKISEMIDLITYKTAQYFGQRKTDLLYLDQRLDRLSPFMKLDQLHVDLKRYQNDLAKVFAYQLETKFIKVDQFKSRLKSPEEKISQLKERHFNLLEKLDAQIIKIKEHKFYKFEIQKAALNSLNPLALMDKGFAVISKDDHVLTSVNQIEVHDEIGIRLKDGSIKASVTRKEEN